MQLIGVTLLVTVAASNLVYIDECDCSYSDDGCKITLAAPTGKACKCHMPFFLTCEGSVVRCIDPNSAVCETPDKSVESCFEGGGNCNGYECDCSYSDGGCTITDAAPPGSACYCHKPFFLTCGGDVVECKDRNSAVCKKPDKSAASCVQGEGNCEGYECDCSYSDGGCTITDAAPPGSACYCHKPFFLTCAGDVVECKDPNSAVCKKPDTSAASCVQGDGNCEGYECDCSYSNGGCTITDAAPPGSACRCHQPFFLTCGGDVVECKDPNSAVCKTPDKSLISCVQGGGSCEGYGLDCDCSYSNGGCHITKAAPTGTSCHCYQPFFLTCAGEVVY